jgi:feruloyl esterase
VQGTLTPTPASSIRFEVWLPAPGAWNGKFVGTGNGGFGGNFALPFFSMLTAVPKGYAAAGSDLGHTSIAPTEAAWALNQPDKIKDFAYRANHLTAIAAKTLIADYYGSTPKRAYFEGCSDGGREALMEAQRFPDDYEGVVAGAPAYAWTRLMTAFAWDELAAHGKPESVIPVAKLAVIQAAAYDQCKRLDTLGDGYFDDPRQCRFNPAKLRCTAGDGPQCLTDAQLVTLRKIYQGSVNPRTGAHIFPGYTAGAEGLPGTWDAWIVGPDDQHGSFAEAFFKDMVFSDPKWKLKSFDFDHDVARADRELRPIVNADDPDLTAFRARGGKLILYHGWADAGISPQSTINYYKAVRSKLGVRSSESFVRLFMVPGMGHCTFGPGPNTFDALAALDQWAEHGAAPERIIAGKYQNELMAFVGSPGGPALKTRPLCAYPKVARWTGVGSKTDAAEFTCKLPGRGG